MIDHSTEAESSSASRMLKGARADSIIDSLLSHGRRDRFIQNIAGKAHDRKSDRPSQREIIQRETIVQYWVKVVFVDNQELMIRDAIRHTISEDMEVLEVDSAKEVIIVPMKQIKYIACDATVFAQKPKS
jgi:hypothetical protein